MKHPTLALADRGNLQIFFTNPPCCNLGTVPVVDTYCTGAVVAEGTKVRLPTVEYCTGAGAACGAKTVCGAP